MSLQQGQFGTPAHTCARQATTVVADEDELLAAVAAASPGDVIAVDGMITVSTRNVRIATDNVTLTCATSGAGIDLQNGRHLETFANGVVVSHLVIDAAAGSPLSVILFGSDDPTCCSDVQFSDNVVRGFQLTGVFAVRSIVGLVVSRNRFEGTPTALSAIQVQGASSGGLIARNTAEMPLGAFSGISVLGAERMTVIHNTVSGAPFAALRLGTTKSVWKSNHVDGATGFGLLFEFPDRCNNLIWANSLTGSGTAGMLVREACRNVFLGNNLQNNADDVGVVFEETTGDNIFIGNGTIVSDDGVADCDEDGEIDANLVTGAGSLRRGLPVGQLIKRIVSVWVNGEKIDLY